MKYIIYSCVLIDFYNPLSSKKTAYLELSSKYSRFLNYKKVEKKWKIHINSNNCHADCELFVLCTIFCFLLNSHYLTPCFPFKSFGKSKWRSWIRRCASTSASWSVKLKWLCKSCPTQKQLEFYKFQEKLDWAAVTDCTISVVKTQQRFISEIRDQISSILQLYFRGLSVEPHGQENEKI